MNVATSDASTLCLPEVFTLANVEAFKNSLDANITGNDAIQLDASKVERVDGAGIQLLVHCSKLLVKDPSDFVLLQPSDILQDALRVMGMASLLEREDSQADNDSDADDNSDTVIEPQAS